MKVAVKITIALVVIFAILGALGFLVYRNMPQLKDKIAEYLARNPQVGANMESAYAKFLESCESAAKRKTKERGVEVTPEMEAKLHDYCLCAQGEFKTKFTPKEIIAIGLNKMTSSDPQIDRQKLEQIADTCRPKLQ